MLGTDGSFFGEAAAGPDLLATRTLNVEVVATAALEVVKQQASSAFGGGSPEAAREDYLFVMERDSLRHRITTRMSPVGRTLFEKRLECGKWLPFGEYRVILESPVFEALPEDIALSAASARQVTLQCSLRRDLVEFVVEVRSTAGDQYTDFPVLEISDGPGRELIEAPDVPGVLVCGDRLFHYRQLPDRVDGTWGFRLDGWQPKSLTITALQAGTLDEHRDPVRGGVLRVVLDWTPEADEPEPR